MNVIIYWKSGDYADVYNVDKVYKPSDREPSLRMAKQFKGTEVEVARFLAEDVRGWQIFLTAEDASK